jgi:IS30 family transposase
MFEELPATFRKSTTLDNGRENHMHQQLKDLGIDTYFLT